VPLIYTSKGNVPIASLRYEHKWEDNDRYTALHEFWFDGDEIVKNSTHMLAKSGLVIGGQQAQM
jgi:hypothetical protein